jgi:hypothetical protein
MSDSATDIFKKRKDEGYYSSLTRRYLVDREMKFMEFFRVSRDIFHFNLKEIKEDITAPSCSLGRERFQVNKSCLLHYGK